MEWLKNLSNAIDYIENNLDKTISYEEAASIACCSTYYFQRMFSYVAGTPLSEYIRRRRMTQAAFDLQSSNQRVLDIALKYGYTSPTSFNRAFQSVHGIAPAAAKNKGNVLNAYPPIRFSVQVTGGMAMHYRIEDKEAIRIASVRIPLSEDMESNQKAFVCQCVLCSKSLAALKNQGYFYASERIHKKFKLPFLQNKGIISS